MLNWYKRLAGVREEHSEFAEGDFRILFPEDEQIFAYTRENESAKATILINLSAESLSYDASCVKNADLIAGSLGDNRKGELAPFEAVIYEEPSR